MSDKKANPNAAQRVTNIESLTVLATYLKNVTTASRDLPTILGITLDSDVGAIEVNNQSGGTITFNSGTAVVGTNATINDTQTYIFFGRKAELDLIELIAGGTLSVSFIQHKAI